MPYLSDDDGNTNGASDHDGKINLRDQCAANLYYVHMYIACARRCTQARTHNVHTFSVTTTLQTLSDNQPPTGLMRAPIKGPIYPCRRPTESVLTHARESRRNACIFL